MTTKIFFDTEFTGLHKDTTLISIGMVDQNGRTFYAELTDFDRDQCDDWIAENVIKHLTHKGTNQGLLASPFAPLEVLGSKNWVEYQLRKWLAFYDRVQLVSDVCHYDMVLFIDLFGSAQKLPDNVCPACHDINQDIAKFYNISEADAFDMSRETIATIGNQVSLPFSGEKHNALFDARVIKQIYERIYPEDYRLSSL